MALQLWRTSRRSRPTTIAAALTAALLATSACGGMSDTPSESAAEAAKNCESTTKVRVVLQWVAQAQFAGYYAAREKGYYAEECLDVTIQEGGVNIVPQQVLSAGNAEFAVSHVTKTMVTRAQGANLVNIGQVFQRGAYLQVAWADSGIKSLTDLKGKKVGSWGYGNELVLFAAMKDAGVDPKRDAEIIQQPFDMSLLLRREIDAAQAKTYNEYAQLLETKNPATGKLYQPSDFSAISLQDAGYTSLEDGIYARGDWLGEQANQDTAVKFLKATYRGWGFCRDDLAGCVDIVLDNGSALGQGHQTWMLNEINKLIWPASNGVGMMDQAAWDQTIKIAIGGGVLKTAPDKDAFRTDLSQRANDGLKADGFDVNGNSYKPQTVTITEGGK
ncbi:ABC transporter substrate-binding protein [Micromonospora sp. NBC_01655]|uniref:ABC transporter substrate-binding protein n=1 Tax=Micromonospora sp. NBC_01655 TaxID=2975983 RepID=UPI0022596E9C|nr:ABC transporter substrate-binding protein [Micromonospora sp. NBC_01655]MCX4471550.1 ABC transporter substrate-binding protein [Micromonospora sp. NBC_01655]